MLLALPIASCALKLDDKAVTVAVGLRLGLDLCFLHQCPCGVQADARNTHSFVCKRAPGQASPHHVLYDVVVRSFSAAGITVVGEPAGLCGTDRRCSDGIALIPWEAGSLLCGT